MDIKSEHSKQGKNIVKAIIKFDLSQLLGCLSQPFETVKIVFLLKFNFSQAEFQVIKQKYHRDASCWVISEINIRKVMENLS